LTLYFMGPKLSREEAAEIRRLLGGKSVVVCEARAHTAGQPITGDAIVIGKDASTAEEDCQGSLKRYASMDDFREKVAPAKPSSPAPKLEEPLLGQSAEPPPSVAASPTEETVQSPTEETVRPDDRSEDTPTSLPDLEKMDRGALIQLAAQLFPKQRRWATLPAVAIREAMVELDKKRR
jgi:hypothetical protein